MNSCRLYSSIMNSKVKCPHGAITLYRCSKTMIITFTRSKKLCAAIVYLYCLAIGISSASLLQKADEIKELPLCYFSLLYVKNVWLAISGESLEMLKCVSTSVTWIKHSTTSYLAETLTMTWVNTFSRRNLIDPMWRSKIGPGSGPVAAKLLWLISKRICSIHENNCP